MLKILNFVIIILTIYISPGEKDLITINLKKNPMLIGSFDGVLRYYQYDRPDPDKYEAACYLISNLQHHYSRIYLKKLSPGIDSAFKAIDSLTKRQYFSSRRVYKNLIDKEFEITATTLSDFKFEHFSQNIAKQLAIKSHENLVEIGARKDIDDIDPEFLIDHIENAFKHWRSSNLAATLSKEEFYQNILPYRSRNEAIDIKSSEINKILQPIIHGTSETDIERIVNDLNSYLFYVDCFENKASNLGDLGFFDILQFYNFDCGRHSEWTTRTLRAAGVPTAMDFTPSWLDRDRDHFWVSICDKLGKWHPFTPKWQATGDSSYFKNTSKVFRYMFERQPGPGFDAVNENVPEIFLNPCLKDVTNLYHDTKSIVLPVKTENSSNHYAYLCIFSASGWKPIGWGILTDRGTIAKFEMVRKEATYIVAIARDGKLHPVSMPFYVDKSGKIIRIITNRSKKVTMTLDSKFYEKDHLIEKMKETVGAEIQIASIADFSDAKTIYRLREENLKNMSKNFVQIKSKLKGKYVRIHGKSKNFIHLSELQFFSDLNGKNQLKPRPHFSNPDVSSVFDSNLDTYIITKSLNLTFSDPENIGSMIIAPRTANNKIVPGDRYELLYYDGSWRSAGIRKAKVQKVSFSQIPSGTIYWLRNLDNGKEEQAFQYAQNKQYYLNKDPFQQ